MRIKEIKKIQNHSLTYEMIKKGKIKFNCPILILHQSTGFYFTRPLVVEGVQGESLDYLMDELFDKYNDDEMPFPLYTFNEVIDDIGETGYENYLYEYYFPLNGGEYYTDNILEIEKVYTF